MLRTALTTLKCPLREASQCRTRSLATAATTQRPILWHYFENQVPYIRGLEMQEALVSRRIQSKAALQAHEDNESKLDPDAIARHTEIAQQDVILLLQHTPVYTTGRRETDEAILKVERERLTAIGADYIATQRGGQTTYHGPGQLVGYPILDLNEMNIRTRTYVEGVSSFLEKLLIERLGVPLLLPSPHVGAYPSETSKIGSIGIQLRKRITSHGFSLNVTDEVRDWFDKIIACGDASIKATSIESEYRRLGKLGDRRLDVPDVVPLAVETLAEILKRDIKPIAKTDNRELHDLLQI